MIGEYSLTAGGFHADAWLPAAAAVAAAAGALALRRRYDRVLAAEADIAPPAVAEGWRQRWRDDLPEAAAAVVLALLVASTAPLASPEMPWAAGLLGWALLALALIDRRHGILPDALTLPLLLGGLAFNWRLEGALPADSAIGAAAGYAGFALVRALYGRLREREGLGLGDVKLLGAAGAWLGWAALPAVVGLAAVAALATVLAARLLSDGEDAATALAADREIRFGPFLCLAVWVVFLYRDAGFC
jgi:leader peptidase (prepilin peptidase)/N-methyltransferase